jgi:hypothetical protein
MAALPSLEPSGYRTCDILVRSYYRDLRWLGYCLASIERWCNGFRDVVVVVPASSLPKLRHLGVAGERVAVCADYRDDYLGQQVTKLYADEYSDADLICHVDSDCVFRRPTTPADLMHNGRPVQLYEPYARLGRHVPWRALTEAFLGFDVPLEFMRRPPYAYPRWLYPRLRDFCAVAHGTTIDTYVLRRPPRGFSEFNALGGYAWRHHRTAFHWVDAGGPGAPDPPCRVFWSRAGLDPPTRAEIARLLA